MERIQLFLAGLLMLAVGSGMAAYEWSRLKTKEPLFNGSQVVTLYWCSYLTLLVLAVVTAIAGVVRS